MKQRVAMIKFYSSNKLSKKLPSSGFLFSKQKEAVGIQIED